MNTLFPALSVRCVLFIGVPLPASLIAKHVMMSNLFAVMEEILYGGELLSGLWVGTVLSSGRSSISQSVSRSAELSRVDSG